MALTRVACDEEGEGDGGKSNGDEGGRRATATGLTKAGGGWRKSTDEATTRPRRWATTNDESVQRMTMAATKRAGVDRAMVTEMRVVGD